jgi:hypothetical protein
MTKQELLDRAYAHMVRQRSVAYDTKKQQCVYEDKATGKMCAIGGAVPAAVRSELMSSNIGAICDIFAPITEWGYSRQEAPLAVAELADCGVDFARDVQTELHDEFAWGRGATGTPITVAELDVAAAEIADEFNLLHPNRKRGVSHSDPKLVEAHAAEAVKMRDYLTNPLLGADERAEYEAVLTLPNTLFQGQLRKAGACFKARIWVGAKTAREAWATCPDAGWMGRLAWAVGGAAALNLTWLCRTADECRAALPFEKLQEIVRLHNSQGQSTVQP